MRSILHRAFQRRGIGRRSECCRTKPGLFNDCATDRNTSSRTPMCQQGIRQSHPGDHAMPQTALISASTQDKPWDTGKRSQINTRNCRRLCSDCINAFRLLTYYLAPVLPKTAERVADIPGIGPPLPVERPQIFGHKNKALQASNDSC